jgi:hypothetical protein
MGWPLLNEKRANMYINIVVIYSSSENEEIVSKLFIESK